MKKSAIEPAIEFGKSRLTCGDLRSIYKKYDPDESIDATETEASNEVRLLSRDIEELESDYEYLSKMADYISNLYAHAIKNRERARCLCTMVNGLANNCKTKLARYKTEIQTWNERLEDESFMNSTMTDFMQHLKQTEENNTEGKYHL